MWNMKSATVAEVQNNLEKFLDDIELGLGPFLIQGENDSAAVMLSPEEFRNYLRLKGEAHSADSD